MEYVKWTRDIFNSYPEWAAEPDIQGISQAVQQNGNITCSDVTELCEGEFHKVYDVKRSSEEHEGSTGELVVRVSLPIEPRWKTLSEVATMEWLRANTSVPIPEVMAYAADRTNPAGLEWILMTKLPGRPLADVWESMEWTAKEKLVAQIAEYMASVFQKQLKGIGSIYPDSPVDAQGTPKVGRIVAKEFFWEQRGLQNVDRGPFRSSRDWFTARLQLLETEFKERLVKYAGPDGEFGGDEHEFAEAEFDEAQRALPLVKKLQAHISDVFGEQRGEEDVEVSVLWHDDLNSGNILVDDAGTLTGVIDWECASAVPLWKACCHPEFLSSKHREEKPDQSVYGVEEDGTPNSGYFEHLDEYECTCLRAYLLDQMKLLEPKWFEIYEASETKRDFEDVLLNCDTLLVGSVAKDYSDWLDNLSTDNPRRLDDIVEENERLRMERSAEESDNRRRWRQLPFA